jgi:hypothetical protein
MKYIAKTEIQFGRFVMSRVNIFPQRLLVYYNISIV